MVSKIWGFFIVTGIITCLITNKIQLLNTEILSSATTAVNTVIKIFPLMALWLGIMNIAKESGLLDIIRKKLTPILSFLFPEIPKNHESLNYISSNIIANMFGLGNAATPFGLKAMESMQKLNKNKTVATNSMITFLVLNTSGVTLIPTTIISLRILYDSSNPTGIVVPAIIATTISTVSGLLFDRFIRRRCKNK